MGVGLRDGASATRGGSGLVDAMGQLERWSSRFHVDFGTREQSNLGRYDAVVSAEVSAPLRTGWRRQVPDAGRMKCRTQSGGQSQFSTSIGRTRRLNISSPWGAGI
jgi:hypothetical protein